MSDEGGRVEKVETRVVGSPAAMATNAAVLGFARAARSFTLYDPANKVVRTLIADYRDKMRKALDEHGPMPLDVHPFELVRGREVVYVEKDRERSLAFRLFRDGVRRLTFLPAVTWEELLRLLEVFSIRFTGVRQQEDDLVTLLRKAAFTGIETAAVEGFVPDEEQPEEGEALAAVEADTLQMEPPEGWDLPLPAPGPPVQVPRREVPANLLAGLQAEVVPEATGAQAVAAVGELVHAARSAEDLGEALSFAGEVRDFLLVDADGSRLLALARVVGETVPAPERPAALQGLLSELALITLLCSERIDPRALGAVLGAAGGDQLEVVLALGRRIGAAVEQGARRVLAAALGAEGLEKRLRESEPDEARVLLGALAEADRPRALRLATEACRGRAGPLTVAALALLGEAPGPEVLPVLRERLADPDPGVRMAAARALAHGGPRAAALLQAHAEKHHADCAEDEAQEFGRALAEAAPAAVGRTVQGWLAASGKGILGRLALPRGLQWVAVGALGHAPGPEAEAALQQLAHSGEGEVRTRAASLLSARGGGGARG